MQSQLQHSLCTSPKIKSCCCLHKHLHQVQQHSRTYASLLAGKNAVECYERAIPHAAGRAAATASRAATSGKTKAAALPTNAAPPEASRHGNKPTKVQQRKWQREMRWVLQAEQHADDPATVAALQVCVLQVIFEEHVRALSKQTGLALRMAVPAAWQFDSANTWLM